MDEPDDVDYGDSDSDFADLEVDLDDETDAVPQQEAASQPVDAEPGILCSDKEEGEATPRASPLVADTGASSELEDGEFLMDSEPMVIAATLLLNTLRFIALGDGTAIMTVRDTGRNLDMKMSCLAKPLILPCPSRENSITSTRLESPLTVSNHQKIRFENSESCRLPRSICSNFKVAHPSYPSFNDNHLSHLVLRDSASS